MTRKISGWFCTSSDLNFPKEFNHKVHISYEGHKNWQNLHHRFDTYYIASNFVAIRTFEAICNKIFKSDRHKKVTPSTIGIFFAIRTFEAIYNKIFKSDGHKKVTPRTTRKLLAVKNLW